MEGQRSHAMACGSRLSLRSGSRSITTPGDSLERIVCRNLSGRVKDADEGVSGGQIAGMAIGVLLGLLPGSALDELTRLLGIDNGVVDFLVFAAGPVVCGYVGFRSGGWVAGQLFIDG